MKALRIALAVTVVLTLAGWALLVGATVAEPVTEGIEVFAQMVGIAIVSILAGLLLLLEFAMHVSLKYYCGYGKERSALHDVLYMLLWAVPAALVVWAVFTYFL